jgi:hypothetical protein
MSDMTAAEKLELALIPGAGIIGWFMAARLPAQISIGALLLGASVLLLLQGLVRDLWLISQRNRQSQVGAPQEALCMCVESTVGVTGVIAGLIILGSSIDSKLSADPLLISFLTTGVLIIGFAIKDFIFELRPFRIRRDKDHLNIIFSWKR